MASLGVVLTLAVFGATQLTHHLRTPLAPETTNVTAAWIPETVKRWQQPISTMAERYDIDPNLLAIIMTMESGGYSKADSGQAQGLMQITPVTAQEIAAHDLKQSVRKYNIWDPNTNIEFGAAYLAKLRTVYGSPDQGPSWNGTVELVAAAYNGGYSAANSLYKGQGLTDTQTVVYSRDAFNMWRERHASDSPTFDRWKERGGSDLINQAKAEMQAAQH
jgi:soluble lytic murein transglycosylase-like protein